MELPKALTNENKDSSIYDILTIQREAESLCTTGIRVSKQFRGFPKSLGGQNPS